MHLPVALDVPDAAVPRVRYAVATLLHGLGLVPAWTDDAGAMFSVGTQPEASGAAVRLRLRPEALLGAGRAEVARLGWLVHAGRRWPLPVGPGGDHAPAPRAVVEAAVVESAFWWLAGVQEAATTARDVHGRVRHADSLQAHLPLRDQPAVDGYRLWLADALGAAGVSVPGRRWGGAPWALALTHDVDALATRRVRAGAAELARGRPATALRRALGPDARRASVHALASLARRHGARATFFWKGGATAREDVPYRLDARLLHALAADGFEAGLHPSYHAHAHPPRLAAERDAVARAAGAAPVAVRSHFLRWREPATPDAYAAAGLALDSTLGWAEAPGFRRGTAAPFRLWRLSTAGSARDHETPLWEWPLAVMDTTLFAHQQRDPASASAVLAEVAAAAQAVGGGAVVLWHPAMDAGAAWTMRLDVLDHAAGQARATGAAVNGLAALFAAWNGSP